MSTANRRGKLSPIQRLALWAQTLTNRVIVGKQVRASELQTLDRLRNRALAYGVTAGLEQELLERRIGATVTTAGDAVRRYRWELNKSGLTEEGAVGGEAARLVADAQRAWNDLLMLDVTAKAKLKVNEENMRARQYATHLGPGTVTLPSGETVFVGQRLPVADFNKHVIQLLADKRERERGASSTPVAGGSGKRRKRTTERGEAKTKVIAALTKHHQYDDGSCLNSEPITVRELARQAGIGKASASRFFKAKFKGHDKYRALCRRDASGLVAALKILNGEMSPHILYGRNPPSEGTREDE